MIGTSEIIVIALVAFVLLFGAGEVPELARSLGLALGEFKKAQREAELGLKNKRFEESATGEEGAIPKTKPKAKAKTEDLNIKEVAAYMGIVTEGKTEEELKGKIKAKLESFRSHR